MTFDYRERSRTKGNPVTLFLFRYGAGASEYYAYTNAEQEIVHSAITYQPIPIDYGSVESSGTLDKKTLTVKTPLLSEVANLWLVSPPTYPVTLVMRRGHLNDPSNEFLVEWSGRVLSCSREGVEAVFSCEPISTAMRRTGLRRHYQYGCPHVLYGPQCNANKAAATYTPTIIAVENAALTFNDGWAGGLEIKALGGIAEWTGPNGTIVRAIIGVDDLTRLRLNGPTTGLESGDTVSISLGCNHRFEHNGTAFVDTDCFTVHNNVPNFGGQPYIPTDNPIGTATNKYY